MKTLLVEDDATTRQYLAELLGANGFAVTAVDTVEAALAAFDAEAFEFVVTDWLMENQDRDGLDLCRAIRARAGGEDVFVLVVTVRNQPQDLEAVLDAGADDYVAKPVDAGTMNIRLRVARERHRIREERAGAMRALHTVVDNAPLALFMTDAQGRFTFAQGRGLELVWKEDESPLGKTAAEMSPTVPGIAECVRRALAGETFTEELAFPDPTWEAWCAPVRNGSTTPSGAIVVCTDITARKVAEQDAREGYERFRRFTDAAFEGIAIVKDAKVVDANDQFARLVGRTDDEVANLPVETLIAPVDLNRARQFMRDMPDTPFRHRLVRGDGSTVPVEVRIRPVQWHGENVMVAAVLDVSESEKAESERAAMKERLERAKRLESLGVMAGGIAHDFNNMLMGVMGNASLAAMEAQPGSDFHTYVSRIETSARDAADLTNKMLAFSGRSVLSVQPINLAELVAGLEGALRERVGELRLVLELDENVPAVQADSRHIAQAVEGLVTNAVEAYGNARGTITVRVSARDVTPEDLERASTAAGDACTETRVAIDVIDHGPGMDAKTVGRVFDPFFSTKFTGRGIGLAAVMGTVRSHHGSIAVNSARGLGTTVSMFFPLHVAVPAAPETPPSDTSREARRKVLVIDDEQGVRDVTRVMLERNGFVVVTAPTGRDGVSAFETESDEVAVTLLDLTMPDMSGATVFQKLRDIDPAARIILMSGWDEEHATKDFRDSGLAGFLHKPFPAPTLIEKVNEVAQSMVT